MFFFVKTRHPRPTFHLDMTAEERAMMEGHLMNSRRWHARSSGPSAVDLASHDDSLLAEP